MFIFVNIKPIYLIKNTLFSVSFDISNENYLLLQRKCALKMRFTKVWVLKTLFSDDLQF